MFRQRVTRFAQHDHFTHRADLAELADQEIFTIRVNVHLSRCRARAEQGPEQWYPADCFPF
jgi:hypothetical protein